MQLLADILPRDAGVAVLALISALGGGFVVKLIERRYQLREKQLDVAANFRDELREEIGTLRDELDECEQQRSELYDKKCELQEENLNLRSEVAELKRDRDRPRP